MTLKNMGAEAPTPATGDNLESLTVTRPDYYNTAHGLSVQDLVQQARSMPPAPVAPPAPPAFDTEPAPDDLQPREPERPRYRVMDNAFYQVDYREGEINRKLCNWQAKILQEVTRDDGQEVTRQLVIAGQIETGQRLPQIRVDSRNFPAMGWVLEQWGSRAIIHAGSSTKDKIREAIQVFSSPDCITHYTHTGWREINGQRVYLSAAGALGMENITVELEGNLKRYAIPGGPLNDLAQAWQASLRFLEVAPHEITFPLWGAMFLAPLTEIIYPDFVLYLYGQSGSLKSTLAALALSHYGDFSYHTLPESWESTENILEKHTFTVKDAPLVIDDFAPQASGADAQTLERKAQRLIRAIGNRSSRNRMTRNMEDRPGFSSRGLVISTGEQLPSTESIIARTLPVQVKRDLVNLKNLTKAQRQQQLYPQALAGYLRWLAANWERLRSELPERQNAIKDRLREQTKAHLRTPEMFSKLLLGIETGLAYYVTLGLGETQKQKLLAEAEKALLAVAANTSELVLSQRASLRFLDVLRTLAAQNKITLQPLSDPKPLQDLLGWFDEDFIYLLGEAAYNTVAKFCRDEGAAFSIKQAALYDMLANEGFLIPGKDKSRTVVKILDKSRSVIKLYRSKADLL